jgi:hypothetical protein
MTAAAADRGGSQTKAMEGLEADQQTIDQGMVLATVVSRPLCPDRRTMGGSIDVFT